MLCYFRHQMTVKLLWQQQNHNRFGIFQRTSKIKRRRKILQTFHYTFLIINALLSIDPHNMQILTSNFSLPSPTSAGKTFLELFTNIVSLTSRVPQTLVIRF